VERFADNVQSIGHSFALITPELTLLAGVVVLLLAGMFRSNKGWLTLLTALVVATSLIVSTQQFSRGTSMVLFGGMMRLDSFGSYLKILFDVAALLTLAMSWKDQQLNSRTSEYYILVIGVLLGAHLLAMSVNFVMVFISLELISLASYVLTGYAFNKTGAEGSFKYFVFGSVASAIMLYGFSLLYGVSGTLTFETKEFISSLAATDGILVHVASLLVLAGFLYKMAAAPMHPWAPDVYESAPMPVVGYFSVVPKLAGLAVLIRFTQALPVPTPGPFMDWQDVIAVVAIVTIIAGNFSALWQRNPKRLMAYSSIAQSGFLLIGVVAAENDGVRLALFYATVYLAANFLVFIYLQFFESHDIHSLESFSGTGRSSFMQSILLLVGLISLTGLPPTSGFTSKLFIFSALWEAYGVSGKPLLLWLLIFGLLNTVVSLFYYIRIPYFAFIRPGSRKLDTNIVSFENLFGLVIVVVVLGLFFNPGVLMGWINKINFAL
jgi:NADH-quinone oxidoreductase subunit N